VKLNTGNGRTLIALVLVAGGTLWLLVTVGFVPSPLLDVLRNWWPLFLIGGGLDLALPRNRPLHVPYTALAGIVVVVLALLGVSLGGPRELHYRLERGDDVRSAEVSLRLGSAATDVTTVDTGTLFTAVFAGEPRGEVNVGGIRVAPSSGGTAGGSSRAAESVNSSATATEAGRASITVRPLRSSAATFLDRGRWSVGLPRDLPLDLSVDGGSGRTTLDLAELQLTNLSISVGSGSIDADLPGLGTAYRADVVGGSGSFELWIAPGASLDLDARFRSGSADVHVGEGTDLRLALITGSGAVTLGLPGTAPIHLDIRDDGSGRLSLPSYLRRRSGSGDTGVWESDSLGRGGRVIEVRIVQVGSGSITIR